MPETVAGDYTNSPSELVLQPRFLRRGLFAHKRPPPMAPSLQIAGSTGSLSIFLYGSEVPAPQGLRTTATLVYNHSEVHTWSPVHIPVVRQGTPRATLGYP